MSNAHKRHLIDAVASPIYAWRDHENAQNARTPRARASRDLAAMIEAVSPSERRLGLYNALSEILTLAREEAVKARGESGRSETGVEIEKHLNAHNMIQLDPRWSSVPSDMLLEIYPEVPR